MSIDTLRAKIAAHSDAVSLNASLDDTDKSLLTQGLQLFQPWPYGSQDWRRERIFFAVDQHGNVVHSPLPPSAFSEYGQGIAGDEAILRCMVAEQIAVETQTWGPPTKAFA